MLKAYYQLSKITKNRINNYRKKVSKSFVAEFIRILYNNMYYNAINHTNTIGSTASLIVGSGSQSFQVNAGSGNYILNFNNADGIKNSSFGIMLGSGTDAVITTDDNIVTPITYGTSSGQLEYLGTFSPLDVTVVSSTASFMIERLFLNSSGGDVTVKEIGMYSLGVPSSGTYRLWCIARDLVSPAVTVANGEYLKVSYTIQVTC